MNSRTHEPVLPAEVLALVPADAQLVLDCTIGGGGHAETILRKLGSEVELIGFDRDVGALEVAGQRLKDYPNKIQLVHDSYANLDRHLGASREDSVDFALFDLGLSSLQLDKSGRGFSYQMLGEPLDLRFDGAAGVPLVVKLSNTTVDELTAVLKQYGEVKNARRIARDVITATETQSFSTVGDLVKILNRYVRDQNRNQFFAQVWQALRIWVNEELAHLEKGLAQVVKYLKPGGTITTISFHSLEDRIVKNFFLNQEHPCVCPRELPRCACGRKPTLERITKKAVKPTATEIADNPRARSARLRAARKLAMS